MARQFAGATLFFYPMTISYLHSPYTPVWSFSKGALPTYRTAKNYLISESGTSTNGSNFFNEIDAISTSGSGGTKITTILVQMNGAKSLASPNGNGCFITIDWEKKKMSYSGSFRADSPEKRVDMELYIMGETVDIPETNTPITLYSKFDVGHASRPQNGHINTGKRKVATIQLDLAQRKITALPVFNYSLYYSNIGGSHNDPIPLRLVSYRIETDNYQSVTSSTKPDPTKSIDVSGVKISELTTAETPLKDSDLLVLSQGGEDGTYDSSNNIRYKDLSAEMEAKIGGDLGDQFVKTTALASDIGLDIPIEKSDKDGDILLYKGDDSSEARPKPWLTKAFFFRIHTSPSRKYWIRSIYLPTSTITTTRAPLKKVAGR